MKRKNSIVLELTDIGWLKEPNIIDRFCCPVIFTFFKKVDKNADQFKLTISAAKHAGSMEFYFKKDACGDVNYCWKPDGFFKVLLEPFEAFILKTAEEMKPGEVFSPIFL